jgi:hypothetical protein
MRADHALAESISRREDEPMEPQLPEIRPIAMKRMLSVAGVALAAALALAGCTTPSGTGDAPAIPTAAHGELSAQQYAAAVELARHEIRRQDATVTSATATVSRGMVHNPNVGVPCTSGRLLRIKLIGKFPHITTTGGPGLPAGPVRAVLLTADAESGQACLIGVHVGRASPEPGAVALDLA